MRTRTLSFPVLGAAALTAVVVGTITAGISTPTPLAPQAVRERLPVQILSSDVGTDPLSADEWWRAAIGAEGLTPPGPGVPVTIVDSGLDVTHPEFAGRPNTETLNPQEPAPLGGEHGTAVASLVGAPANGQGMVGIYPEALLRSWDTARGAGTCLESAEIVNGILEATRRGRGVINLSLGGPERDRTIERAVAEAVRRGMLVVAATGNDGLSGSPLSYPAALPHVLTVGATSREGIVASFSSRSPYVDLAAPGTGVTVATALGRGWQAGSGTSFSTPLVAGAAAWVWTARPELDAGQVAEILRRSARDIDAPGRDVPSGFGLLDVRAALAHPAPIRDPFEPSDGIDAASTGSTGVPSLTTPARPETRVAARVDAYEDPHDVYRVWLPARRTVVVTATTQPGDVDLALWRQPVGRGLRASDRLVSAASEGTTEILRFRNSGAGRVAFLAVSPRTGNLDADYRLKLRVR